MEIIWIWACEVWHFIADYSVLKLILFGPANLGHLKEHNLTDHKHKLKE